MKFLITERQVKLITEIEPSKLDKFVAEYIFKDFPQLAEPLEKSKKVSTHNKNWGSGLDEYYSFTYYYDDEFGNTWVKENGEFERRFGGHSHYEISDDLERFYNMFGEQMIERFFLIHQGIDITQQDGFKWNWGFY
jgi:hypothetical protein